MHLLSLTATAAAALILAAAVPSDGWAGSRSDGQSAREAIPWEWSSQSTRRTRQATRSSTRGVRNGQRTRITVRARSFLDPGTEVLPLSQPYTDYVYQPLYSPTRIWDTTGAYRSPLPGGPPTTGWVP